MDDQVHSPSFIIYFFVSIFHLNEIEQILINSEAYALIQFYLFSAICNIFINLHF